MKIERERDREGSFSSGESLQKMLGRAFIGSKREVSRAHRVWNGMW
jgi:hypothetical protein